jgi:hypothetical protein
MGVRVGSREAAAAGARHRRHADPMIRFPRTGGPAGRGALRALPRGSGAWRRIVAGKGSTTLPVYVSRTTSEASQGDEPIAVLTATAVALSGRTPCGRRSRTEPGSRAQRRTQVRNAAFVSECSPSIGALRRSSGMPSERPHAAGARHRRHADLRIRFPRTGGPAGSGAMRALPRRFDASHRIFAGKGSTALPVCVSHAAAQTVAVVTTRSVSSLAALRRFHRRVPGGTPTAWWLVHAFARDVVWLGFVFLLAWA